MAAVRAVFFGSGAFALEVLEAAAAAPELELVAVVTAPPRPVGRRGVLTPTPVGERARALDLPILAPERLRDPAFLRALEALRPDVGVLADYGKLLPAAVLELPVHGIVNLHPSLLPRHRGATPIPAAILAGDHETGVSLFRMDAGMDTGPLVAAVTVPIAPTEDAPGLERRLARAAGELLGSSVGPYLAGRLTPRAQPDTGASVTRPLGREDGHLDSRIPAALLERRVRAYRPWPGTYLEIAGGRVGVLRAAMAPTLPGDTAGTIVAHGAGLALATATGRLVLLEVQPAGGRPMEGPAFRRGRPSLLGARVG